LDLVQPPVLEILPHDVGVASEDVLAVVQHELEIQPIDRGARVAGAGDEITGLPKTNPVRLIASGKTVQHVPTARVKHVVRGE
jgi:hypothetical protein